ncbi:MAG: DUF1592 domain-containing protein [Deltaproteobacteria bacterium]|nr:DUF1592 domain-containing protein [Deltaproteobacteria bacterium]
MQSLVRATIFNAALLFAGSSLFACSGAVSNGGADDSDNGGSGGGAGGDTIPPLDPNFKPNGDPDVNRLVCDKQGVAATAAPLRRLTRKQYINTLNDLLGGITQVPADLQLPGETLIDGFDNNAAAQTSTLSLLQGYKSAATVMAKDATSNATKLQKLAPCAGGQSEDACGDKFISDFGKRAFRRPLTSDEVTRLGTVFKAVKPGFGYAQGIEATLTAMLMAPQFTFRPEYGAGAADGAVKLSSYEVASRLSYLLWDTMPDATLMAAADAKKLDTPEGIETEFKRMLDDPRARAAVARFQSQWLGFAKLDKLEKDAKAFPKFDAATKESMTASVEKFVDYAFWDKGSLAALLTDTNAFVDDKLSPIYEVGGSSSMAMVSLDGSKRSGLLTQAGLMAALAKASYDSPVHRGLFVIHNLLCGAMAPAPNGVPPLAEPKVGEARTTRERVEQTHSNSQCAACHKSIDGIGFGFGHYDAIGAYRDQENGVDVNVEGELVGTRDIDGKFSGAIELSKKLAQSSQVQQCVATQWFRYGFGRTETDEDACALKPVVDAFVSSNGNMKKLLTVLVKSDAFRYRNAL